KRLTDIFQNALTDSWLFKPHMSRLLQPPLAARAVLRIYEESGDITFVKEILPKLKKYYKWIIKNRCDNDGLVRLISYFESGMDWKPSFDEVIGLKPGKADWKTFIK